MKMQFHIGKNPAKKKGTTNKRGTILGLVLIVLVIVNILGVGLLSQSTMNAIEVVKNTKSTQAFWIAEAGLGMAISYLPTMPATNPLTGTLGEGGYNATITPVSAYRWTIESVGSVDRATRRIRVEVGPNVTAIMTTSGELKITGNAEVNGDVEEFTTPCFEEVFGMTKAEMQNNATYEYTNPPNNEMPVEQITWVNEDNQFKITKTGGWVGSGIMVVDGDLEMNGGIFDGIIWIIGKLFVSGNPKINGSIFVEGDISVDTTVTGTADITFDEDAIDAAFGHLGTFPNPPNPAILSWQEF